MKRDFFKHLSILFIVLAALLVTGCNIGNSDDDDNGTEYSDLFDASWGYSSRGMDIVYIFSETGYTFSMSPSAKKVTTPSRMPPMPGPMEFVMTTDVTTASVNGKTTFAFAAAIKGGVASDKIITVVDDNSITFQTGTKAPSTMTKLVTVK